MNSFSYDTKHDSVRLVPVVTVGFTTSFLKYKGRDEGLREITAGEANFEPSSGPFIGAGLEGNPRRTKGGAWFAVNLFYRQVKFVSNFTDPRFKNSLVLGFNYIRTNLMIRFTSRDFKPIKVFAIGGASFGVSFAEKNNMKQWSTFDNSLDYNGIIAPFRKMDVGGVIGGGVRRKKLTGEIRLEQAFKYRDDTKSQRSKLATPARTGIFSTTTLMLLVSYTFAK